MSKAEEIARETFKEALEATIAPGERRPSSEVQISVIAAALESYARERVSEWMISQGITTGHGDTLGDLFAELGGEIKRLRAARTREVNNG